MLPAFSRPLTAINRAAKGNSGVRVMPSKRNFLNDLK